MFTNGSPIYPSMPAPSPSNRPDGVLSRYALAGCALLLSACSGSGEEESPTPEVTPTATVVPTQSVDYRIVSFTVADVDENGNTTALQLALDAMADAAYTAIYDAVCSGGSSTATPCLPNLEETLAQIFSVDTLSNAINTPITSGDINYLMHIEGQGSSLTFVWSTGSFQDTGFSVDETVATLSGTLEADGSSTFGPTDVPLTVAFTDPVSGDVVLESTLTLYQSTLALEHIFEASMNGTISADVKPDELTSLLVAVAEAVIPSDKPLPGTLEASVLAAMQPYLDVDLNGDGTNDALSLLALMQGVEVSIVE